MPFPLRSRFSSATAAASAASFASFTAAAAAASDHLSHAATCRGRCSRTAARSTAARSAAASAQCCRHVLKPRPRRERTKRTAAWGGDRQPACAAFEQGS